MIIGCSEAHVACARNGDNRVGELLNGPRFSEGIEGVGVTNNFAFIYWSNGVSKTHTAGVQIEFITEVIGKVSTPVRSSFAISNISGIDNKPVSVHRFSSAISNGRGFHAVSKRFRGRAFGCCLGDIKTNSSGEHGKQTGTTHGV
uniref:Uncharacterized protein n=1 Tax=Cacopsylla melanoneura TaxID=428564 RepID=A0A8D9F152_9HEMI